MKSVQRHLGDSSWFLLPTARMWKQIPMQRDAEGEDLNWLEKQSKPVAGANGDSIKHWSVYDSHHCSQHRVAFFGQMGDYT